MNRKERRSQVSVARKEGTVEKKKQELIEQYGRLAAQAGDLNYRVYVLNKEMENIQRQHSAFIAQEQKEKKDAEPFTQEVIATPANSG